MPSVEVVSVGRLVRTDDYWRLVRRTYEDVLKAGDPEPVEELRRRLAERSQEEQILFYHGEPLNVALDLLQTRDEDPERLAERTEQYLRIARDLGWPINRELAEQAPD